MKDTRRNIVVGLLALIGSFSAQSVNASPVQLPHSYLPIVVPATPSHQIVSFTPRYNYRPMRNRHPGFYYAPPPFAVGYGYLRPYRQMPMPVAQQRFRFRPMSEGDQRYVGVWHPRGYPLPQQVAGPYPYSAPYQAMVSNRPSSARPVAPWSRQFARTQGYVTAYRYRPLNNRGRYAPAAFMQPRVRYAERNWQRDGKFASSFRPATFQPLMERKRKFADFRPRTYAASPAFRIGGPPIANHTPTKAFRPITNAVPYPSLGPSRALQGLVAGLKSPRPHKRLRQLARVAPLVGIPGPRREYPSDFAVRHDPRVDRATYRLAETSRSNLMHRAQRAVHQNRYRFRPDARLSGGVQHSRSMRAPAGERDANAYTPAGSNAQIRSSRSEDASILAMTGVSPSIPGQGASRFSLLADKEVLR